MDNEFDSNDEVEKDELDDDDDDDDEKGQGELKDEKTATQRKDGDDVNRFESSADVYALFGQDVDDDTKLNKEWDVEEWERSPSKETIDSEKEAKEMAYLDVEHEPKERRRTIYELDSYSSTGLSAVDVLKLSSMDIEPEPRKEVRYSISLGMPGIARINLSPLTQKVIGCVIGENVSTEYPWIFVRKEIIEDNIDLHEESSDFLPVKDEIREFAEQKILIGYMPSLTQEGQFYICLTIEGQRAMVEYIKRQREEHENRVRNTVYKPLGKWQELGSADEIETTIVAKTRPLLEIEFVSTADVLNVDLDLVDRTANEQKDGYIELLPYREVFQNISRRLMCAATQVTPQNRDSETQTVISTPANRWTQYGYGYESPDISSFTEEQLEQLRIFLHRFTDEVCDELLLNATWDIYSNDYMNLVRDSRDTQWSVPRIYKENLSFHDGTRVVEKVINDIAWHPLWTGVLFAAYTRYSKSHRLVGPKSHEDVLKADDDNYILTWSFNDSLTPKLVLECTREVTAVASNPLDANLIVGGCANGQIVLWHIPGKIEQIETVPVSTPTQIKYKLAIKNLTTWLRQVSATYVVKPTLLSSLKESQKGEITNITWLSPYSTVDENGVVSSLPEDTSVDDLSTQFVTSSTDGTIAFWDLKLARQKFQKETQRVAKKKAAMKRPETLQPLSPYKHLDRIFRPHYLLIVHHPDVSRRVVISTLTIFVPEFQKQRVDLTQSSKDVTVRRYFKNIVKKPDYEMQPSMFLGTVEGDFGCVKWRGYDFSTGMTVNTEVCEWSWCRKVHDGPITHAIRSRIFSDLIATIGGKIFAIWKETLDAPLIWKKSTVGYTAVFWGRSRPTVLILARMDGTVEIWDFFVKSEEPCITQSLSGRIITGIYIHLLDLDPLCVGFCDYNGTLRMFHPPSTYLKYDGSNERWMAHFIKQQLLRTENCKNWRNWWRETHREIIEEKQRLMERITRKKELEQEDKAGGQLTETDTAAVEVTKTSVRDTDEYASTCTRNQRVVRLKPWEMIEEARARWKQMQLRRMQHVLLEKKGLRKDELERQREPILRMREETKRRREKLKEKLDSRAKIFEHTVSVFFPERPTEVKPVSVSSIGSGIPRRTRIDTALVDKILQGEVLQATTYVDPDELIVQHFVETQSKMLTFLRENKLTHTFDWRKTLREGKSRRVDMDHMLEHNT
ncbi:dynein axonemal intermediate chain 3 [Megalopta genalis]|uniref:dynein axonemal intermediate chain 3 n=1 Tax=Megalopta genalis TaxID=115081 RepID=UPI003FD2AE1B